MLFHFDFHNYFTLLRLAWREPNARVRTYSLSILLLWIPPVATFHALCFFLDGLLFPGLHATQIREPIFIVGHARSGTTLIHRLMSEDEGRFSAFMLYELYFPSLLQKWVIRRIAALDRRLGGHLEARVMAWSDRHYAAMRDMHEMGLTHLEEDDIVLYYSMASGFWITKLPWMGDLDFYYVDEWPERRRRRLMRFYRQCVRRQLYLNGPNKVHLSKNPIFAGRVAALLETFPDARIVVPVRNPYETIPSLLKLMRAGWKRLGWDEARQRRCLAVLAHQSFHTYRHPLEVLAKHPDAPSAVVDYRALAADPAAAIEKVYLALGLELSAAHREGLAARGRRASAHRSGHRYSLEEFGLEAHAIRSELGELFERFGWDEAATERIGPPLAGQRPKER